MNKEEAKKQAAVLRAELDKLDTIINEPEKRGRWKPGYLETYYSAFLNGDVSLSVYKNDSFDKYTYTIGNCFKTREEAEEYKERLIFNQSVLDFISEENNGWWPSWNYNLQNKYYICWTTTGLDITRGNRVKFATDEKFFKSEEIGRKIIAKFDNEKLKNWFI